MFKSFNEQFQDISVKIIDRTEVHAHASMFTTWNIICLKHIFSQP